MVRIEPGKANHDKRLFECTECDMAENAASLEKTRFHAMAEVWLKLAAEKLDKANGKNQIAAIDMLQ